MTIRLSMTGCEYDLNNPTARVILREHLKENGFFSCPEFADLYKVFELSEANGAIVKRVVESIRLFDLVKTGRILRT